MRDNANHPVSFSQTLECINDDLERLWIQRAEALIDKDRVETALGGAHELAQSSSERKREAQRSKEGLTARERGNAPFLVRVVMVDDVEAAILGDEAVSTIRNNAETRLLPGLRADSCSSSST